MSFMQKNKMLIIFDKHLTYPLIEYDLQETYM